MANASSFRIARLSLAVLSLPLMVGCMTHSKAPADLDFSRTRTSQAGTLRGSIRPEGDSIPQGRLHRWTLHLETTADAPVDTVQISIDGGMPQHGHGLPTRPRVTRALGNGDHLVDGMKFNMGGWWVVKFATRTTAGSDTLVFNLKL